MKNGKNFNLFVPNAPFLYPLITENRNVFCCFQGIDRERVLWERMGEKVADNQAVRGAFRTQLKLEMKTFVKIYYITFIQTLHSRVLTSEGVIKH